MKISRQDRIRQQIELDSANFPWISREIHDWTREWSLPSNLEEFIKLGRMLCVGLRRILGEWISSNERKFELTRATAKGVRQNPIYYKLLSHLFFAHLCVIYTRIIDGKTSLQ